ncbi:MAG: protein translocase subunit SecD [Elusimicrobia bacterium]|nr:protein translocase subunit SecD [Elusimicrobiota bacterium]MBU2615151.1 protein translocase subunit SecD [Elusimicrobiota bacterium]
MKNLQLRIYLVIGVLAAATYFLFPSIQWYSMGQQERENKEKSRDKIVSKVINLGLDLKGGTYLLLEIDDSKLEKNTSVADALERAIEIVRNRVDQFGVSEPLITKQGEKWIAVQLPGVKDPERAKEIIGKTALLEFRIVDTSDKLPNISAKMKELNLSFEEASTRKEILKMMPTGYMMLSGRNDGSFYLVKSSPEITGAYLVNAKVELGGEFGLPRVGIEFNNDGAKIFSRVTEANVNKNLAIVLDGVVQSAPVIRTRIPDGKAVIEGNFTIEEAKFYATVLRAGALPAPVRIIEERTVGPSLGEDSIRAGTLASVIGLLLVMIFMIVYYKPLAGTITNIALLLNFFILFGAMAVFHATLTLPGIAGIILSLGMAVDANVLILERMRDELDLGKTSRVAVDLGYERALSAIVDSNLTTLIAAAFMFQFGTGPIKGFAVTLTLGIITSMFTAIFITKIIYDYMFKKKMVERIKL